MDADFAAETANLSRAQILQQAGTAMVAQANQLPQQVLRCSRAEPRRGRARRERRSSSRLAAEIDAAARPGAAV